MTEPTQSARIVLVERKTDRAQLTDHDTQADHAEHEAYAAQRHTENELYANEIEATKQAIRQILAGEK